MERLLPVDIHLPGLPMVGVALHDRESGLTTFQYTPEFIDTKIELAPVKMPLRPSPYQFEQLHDSFDGLPGLLADSLPDTFGKVLIDNWLGSQGRSPDDFTPVERLCYIGSRGMGALEFSPSLRETAPVAEQVEISRLVELAAQALQVKAGLRSGFESEEDLNEILRVGTSAGGARAKAVIAWNPKTGEVMSGQTTASAGFEHWLLKFDGVDASFDGVRDPQGYGRIEYAYHLMAREAGIAMSDCRLMEEGGRAHFMTRRFDRLNSGVKLHYASLFGMAHMGYCSPGTHSHSYENYFETIHRLGLTPEEKCQAFRRMVFNVMACNRDDHVKNFGFLLKEDGKWSLAPAYDMAFAHNPAPGKWTARQQMSVCGKRESITIDDLLSVGREFQVATRTRLSNMISETANALSNWRVHAEMAGVPEEQTDRISKAFTWFGH
ncbi:MAG: type II toxin-antitoxin system HipA family toxin [Verrucomicrobiota bacterium]